MLKIPSVVQLLNKLVLVALLLGVSQNAFGFLPSASETKKGRVELATTTEAAAGTDTERCVTPAGVKAYVDGAGVVGAVMEVDYDANTVLAATSDDTPVTVTVAEQTLLGRITSGAIAALNVTQILTLIGVESGADVTDSVNIASSIVGVAGKTTPVDADTFPVIDSADSNSLKEVTWANIKATFSNSPTLVTPVLGVAAATTLNTGQGDYELYAMNQDLETIDTPEFAGFVLTPTTTGVLSLSDSDSLDANQTIARLTANVTTVTAGAVVSDATLEFKDGGQASGVWTPAFVVDGSDNQVEFAIPTTLQAGDIIKADLATDSVDYTKTEGSYKSLTPVTGDADDFAANFTGANLYGGTFIANGTGTAQLPVMVAGMNFTIITLGAIAVIVDTNAADGYLMDGVTGVEGANLTNLSTAGDIAVFQYYTADDWLITTNGWTAE